VKHAGSTAEERRGEVWATADGGERAELSEEIRRLVRRVGRMEEHGGVGVGVLTDDPHVILDLEVDGVRCVLVRRPLEPAVGLSPREREIARMVAKGYPNKVIARVLEISSWTVSTHLRRIFAKLGVSTRASMIAQLLGDGLLQERDPL